MNSVFGQYGIQVAIESNALSRSPLRLTHTSIQTPGAGKAETMGVFRWSFVGLFGQAPTSGKTHFHLQHRYCFP